MSNIQFPGVWLGKVVEVEDDETRVGRLKVEIPDVYGENIPPENLPWSYPIFPTPIHVPQRSGIFTIPKKGANVCVLFERGDMQSPRWFGGWTPDNRIPFDFQQSEGDKFPNISCWRTVDGMMIRFVEGERLEIYLGESGEFNEDGEWESDGEHSQYDTYLKLDKRRGKVEFRSKFDIDIRCKGVINIRAPQIKMRLMPNTTYNSETEDYMTDPDSPPARFELNVFDPDSKQGSRVIAEPGKLTARARSVHGFEDS